MTETQLIPQWFINNLITQSSSSKSICPSCLADPGSSLLEWKSLIELLQLKTMPDNLKMKLFSTSITFYYKLVGETTQEVYKDENRFATTEMENLL